METGTKRRSIRFNMPRIDIRDQRGFTLLELLIVVLILGILAAIVVFGVLGVTHQASVNACKQEKSTVQSAVDLDFNAHPEVSYGSGQTSGYQNFSTQPSGYSGTSIEPLYPKYVHTQTGTHAYTWDSNGTVSEVGGDC